MPMDAETADLTAMDQEDLVRRAQVGDLAAFDRLVRSLEDRLWRQALAFCHNEALADDLVQQTLIEAWKSLRRFNFTCQFSTWLCAILWHRHQKELRSARSRPMPLTSLNTQEAGHVEALEDQMEDVRLSPASVLEQKEAGAYVRQWIAALPPEQQEVIVLRFFADASLAEMASIAGVPVGTIKSRLHYALEALHATRTVP